MSESVTLKAGTLVTVEGVGFCLCSDVDAEPSVPKVVYPSLMWSQRGDEITVQSADEEADKRAEGYRLTAAAPVTAPPAELPEPEPEDGPTFGAPQDANFGADAKAQKATRKAARKVHKP